MFRKHFEFLLNKERERSKILEEMIDLKNSDLINLKKELKAVKIADEEKSCKLSEIREEISKQNYNSSKNLENKIQAILNNKNTPLDSKY